MRRLPRRFSLNPLSPDVRSFKVLAAALLALAALPGSPSAALAESPHPCAAAVHEGWTQAVAPESLEGAGDVEHTAWQSRQPPGGEYDVVRLHRYRDPKAPGEAIPFLYFPGTNMNGEVAVAEEDHNLWIFLARRGVDVYTLDYRTHAVPAEGVKDLSFMAAWGLEAFNGDARQAALFVQREHCGRPVFVSGFSRGAAFAYGVAAAEPEAVAGVVALDGYFKRHRPKGEGPEDPAAALAALVEAGEGSWATDVGGSRGWAARQALMKAAARDPGSPLPGQEDPAGEVLAGVLHRAWGPGGLANPHLKEEPGVSEARVLARLLAGYDRYYPRLQDLEGLAWTDEEDDPRTTLDDGWPTLRRPVFFVGTTGMGAEFLLDGLASANHCAGGKPEIHVLEDHGHLDVLVGERARAQVFEPLLAWLRKTGSARATAPDPAPEEGESR